MSIKSIQYIQYDEAKLKNALRDFYNAMGIKIGIKDENFSSFLEMEMLQNGYCSAIQSVECGRCACAKSDRALLERCKQTKRVEIHTCHAGLMDVGVPILYEDKIIAYIILGQMKRDADFSSVARYIEHLPIDHSKIREYYEMLPHFSSERIKSVAIIAEMLAKMILLEHVLQPSRSETLARAEVYIAEHLSEELSIDWITKQIHVSKSVLYREFRKHYDCTVNEYINRKRVERSVDLLLNTELSIEDISQKVGFGSAAYYTVNFKREKGMAPLKFRKNHGMSIYKKI